MVDMKRVNDAAALIESYSEKVKDRPELKAYVNEVAPWSSEDVASVEAALKIALPEDVKAFLMRGVHQLTGSNPKGGPSFSIGFDFVEASTAIENTEMLREVTESDATLGPLIASGVAITYEEPCLVVTPEGVYHFSAQNDVLKIADDFTEFLESYAASGCFKAGDFRAFHAVVGADAPFGIAPTDNRWLAAYAKAY